MPAIFQTKHLRQSARSLPLAKRPRPANRPAAAKRRRRPTKILPPASKATPKLTRQPLARPRRERRALAHRPGPSLRPLTLRLPPTGRPERPKADAPIGAAALNAALRRPDALRADDPRNRLAVRHDVRHDVRPMVVRCAIGRRRANDRRLGRGDGRAVPVDAAGDGCPAGCRRPALCPKPCPRSDCLGPCPSIRRESSRGGADGRPTDRVANRSRCGVCPSLPRPTRYLPGPRALAGLQQRSCPRHRPPTAGCGRAKRAGRPEHPRQRRVRPVQSPRPGWRPARRPTGLRSNRPFGPTDRADRRPASRRVRWDLRTVVRKAIQNSRSRCKKKGSFWGLPDESLF